MKNGREIKDSMKKTYEAPKLKEYGDISVLTKAGSLFHDDGNCNGAPGGVGSGTCDS